MMDREAPALQPYRDPAGSRLQALLGGGPLAPVRPAHFLSSGLHFGQYVIVYVVVAVVMLLLGQGGWWGGLSVGVLLWSYFSTSNDDRTRARVLRRLRLQIEAGLRTVTVPLDGWPFAGSSHALCLAAIEIEVDHGPAQLERAVRLGEPRARLGFITARVLRVEFAWSSDPLGLERLERLLFGVLLAHADELGILHIRFRAPHNPAIAELPIHAGDRPGTS